MLAGTCCSYLQPFLFKNVAVFTAGFYYWTYLFVSFRLELSLSIVNRNPTLTFATDTNVLFSNWGHCFCVQRTDLESEMCPPKCLSHTLSSLSFSLTHTHTHTWSYLWTSLEDSPNLQQWVQPHSGHLPTYRQTPKKKKRQSVRDTAAWMYEENWIQYNKIAAAFKPMRIAHPE